MAAAGLSLSAAAFVGILTSEGYTETAVIPTQNDRPTVGFGSTFREDGAPVRMGDRITPVRAVQRTAAHLTKEESAFRASIPGVALHQAEYDVYMDWGYQFGNNAWLMSPMRRNLLAGDYVAACQALKEYRFLTSATATPGWQPYKHDKAGKPIRWRYDCSTPGNKVCAGVWRRQQARFSKCMEAQ